MLKNWTVITQPVRLAADGVLIRERYLLNKKHNNHKHTEKLLSIVGNLETSKQIALSGEEFRLRQMSNPRGGRPLSSYAMEFCLTLPKGYRPTPQQWQLIVKDCCLALAKLCNLNQLELGDFQKRIRAVLHQQEQTARKGSGDHVHLIIGKVAGTRVLNELQQKKATRVIKQAFNAATLRYADINYKHHEVAEAKRGRRLSTWQYEYENSKASLEIEKILRQMQVQTDKWLKAKTENNKRQLTRQKNRLTKSYGQLQKLSLSKKQAEQVSKIKNQLR